MITDDDIRTMLRTKAAEVKPSPDGWEQITARLQDKPARPVGRRLALVGAAAAAVAGTVFVANLPGPPAGEVAGPQETPTTVAAPVASEPVAVASEWLRERVRGVDLPEGELLFSDKGGNGAVLFRSAAVDTEVFVRDEGEGWMVVAASSDMIPLFDVTFDGTNVNGRATPEAGGELTVTWFVDTEEAGTHAQVVRARDDVDLGHGSDRAGSTATVRAILTAGGTTYLSEVRADRPTDPTVATGSHVAVWPAVDSAGLAELQRQADAGERPDLLDPHEVATGFLAEALGGYLLYDVGDFQQGDNTSGEVPYALADGADGTVLLRRTGGEGSIWYVTGATSSSLEITETRREETHLVADVRSSMEGTLTWTGATPVEVRSGQTVSIGRPDTPVGSHPVVVRLVDGERTVALVATLS